MALGLMIVAIVPKMQRMYQVGDVEVVLSRTGRTVVEWQHEGSIELYAIHNSTWLGLPEVHTPGLIAGLGIWVRCAFSAAPP